MAKKRVHEIAKAQGLTMRELGHRYGESVLVPQLCGTATQIAEQLAEIFTSGDADGFVVSPALLPDSFVAFVESVVPELTSLALACTNAGVAACASAASDDRTSIAPSAQATAAIRKTARWLSVAPMDISRLSACSGSRPSRPSQSCNLTSTRRPGGNSRCS